MKDSGPRDSIVYARTFGHGPRTALAIHCTMAHSGAWRGLADEMDGEAKFVAFDMFSHGRSPDWDRQQDYQDANVAAAAPLLTERMDIIGHSFGATVALRLAVEHPEKVRSLTLIEPVYLAVALNDDPAQVADHDSKSAEFTAALATGDDELAARLFNRIWSDGGPRWPQLPEATRAAMTRSIHVVSGCYAALYDDRPGMLQPGVLARVTAPCLLLRGSMTHPVIGVINDGLARRLPDAESVVVEGAGHMLPISRPDLTAREIRKLFARAPL